MPSPPLGWACVMGPSRKHGVQRARRRCAIFFVWVGRPSHAPKRTSSVMRFRKLNDALSRSHTRAQPFRASWEFAIFSLQRPQASRSERCSRQELQISDQHRSVPVLPKSEPRVANKLGGIRADAAQVGASLAKIGPKLVEVASASSKSGRSRPKSPILTEGEGEVAPTRPKPAICPDAL